MPSGETGVRLQAVVAKPVHAGLLPTIIFNQGFTGCGKNRTVYRRRISPAVIARYFVARGWMVLFLQRGGRGKSGGDNGEGLALDGTGYSCAADIALASFARAVEDMDDLLRNAIMLRDVDQTRLVI